MGRRPILAHKKHTPHQTHTSHKKNWLRRAQGTDNIHML